MRTIDVRETMKFLVAAACTEYDYLRANGLQLGFQNIETSPNAEIYTVEVYFEAIDIMGGTLSGNEIYRESAYVAVAILSPLGAGEEVSLTLASHLDTFFLEGTYFYVDELQDEERGGLRPLLPDYAGDVKDIDLTSMRNYVNGVTESGTVGEEGYIAPVPGLKVNLDSTSLNLDVYTRPNAGYIAVQRPVMVGSSYRDEGRFRLPVTIQYTATSYFR